MYHAGRYPELVRADWVKPGAVVIDVGINVVKATPRYPSPSFTMGSAGVPSSQKKATSMSIYSTPTTGLQQPEDQMQSHVRHGRHVPTLEQQYKVLVQGALSIAQAGAEPVGPHLTDNATRSRNGTDSTDGTLETAGAAAGDDSGVRGHSNAHGHSAQDEDAYLDGPWAGSGSAPRMSLKVVGDVAFEEVCKVGEVGIEDGGCTQVRGLHRAD